MKTALCNQYCVWMKKQNNQHQSDSSARIIVLVTKPRNLGSMPRSLRDRQFPQAVLWPLYICPTRQIFLM